MKSYAPLLYLLLCGCSSISADTDTGPPPLRQTQPPSQLALQKGLGAVVKESQLAQPVEISSLRRTDHGPGEYFVCLREAAPLPDKPHYPYSVFFDDDVFKGSRLSVILDDCEHQQYFRTAVITVQPKKSPGEPPIGGRPQ